MTTLTAPPHPTSYPTLPAAETWPAQGQWTYDDFLRLPEDGIRYEIIAGVLYMTNAPDPEHQNAVFQIGVALEMFIRPRKLGVIYPAPIEVHLPGIAKPVQPDVLFITAQRRNIVKRKIIDGAPDIVVEVLSPATQKRDHTLKLEAYERAGVREYWIANPKTRSVVVYALRGEEYELHGEFGPGETLTSTVLPDFAVSVETLFA